MGGTTASVTIRRLTKGDVPFAMELKNVAGWNQVEADWLGYLDFEPDGCFLAEVDGAPAGTATTITYEGVVGWIGMVLVHPDRRRYGVGTALLHRCIRYLQDKGIASIKLDATPMGRHVYVPLGFADEYDVARYQGVFPDAAPPSAEEAPSSLEASSLVEARLPELAAFDRDAFGVDRSHVLRSLLARDPEWSFLVRDGDGRISGYLLARQGLEAVQLGPWVARDADTAEALLAAAAGRLAGRPVFLDVPAPNEAGARLMRKYGFEIQRGFTRMALGANAAPGRPGQVYGTSGAEKG